MILLIDNYDSFTFNLFQLLATLGAEVEVRRNDEITLAEARALRPAGVVISPGPGTPAHAGVSVDLIREADVPVLGVCLGHQCIGAAFGGQVISAPDLMHGKVSSVVHQGDGVFAGVPSPFEAVRYHSLAVDPLSLPECLEVTAHTPDGTIMGLRHIERPIQGVQFHPESIATREGKRIVANFVSSL